LLLKKTKDYGTDWRILRLSSITDQVFIKAQRIRTLEQKKVSKVGEDIESEYIGIVNYCVDCHVAKGVGRQYGDRTCGRRSRRTIRQKSTGNQGVDVCQKPRLWRSVA